MENEGPSKDALPRRTPYGLPQEEVELRIECEDIWSRTNANEAAEGEGKGKDNSYAGKRPRDGPVPVTRNRRQDGEIGMVLECECSFANYTNGPCPFLKEIVKSTCSTEGLDLEREAQS